MQATAEKAATAKTAVQQKGPPAAEAAAASKEADNADDEDTVVLSPARKGKPGGKSAEQFLKADDLDDDGDVAALPKPSLSQQSDRPSWKKNFAADDEQEEEEEETPIPPTLVKPKVRADHQPCKISPMKRSVAANLRCAGRNMDPQTLLAW